MIQVEKLVKKYDATLVLNELDLTLDHGKIYGLIGPNGAGKTTLMKTLAKVMLPTSGIIKMPDHCKIGFMSDQLPTYKFMRGIEFLIFKSMLFDISKEKAKERALELISVFELDSFSQKWISQLSKGQLQRLVLASTYAHNPNFIILDEPLVGMDPESKEHLKIILQNWTKKTNCTTLISSHQLFDLEQFVDEVKLLYNGKIQSFIQNSSCRVVIKIIGNFQFEQVNILKTCQSVESIEIVDASQNTVIVGLKEDSHKARMELFEKATKLGLEIDEFYKEKESMEQSFLIWNKGVHHEHKAPSTHM